MFCRFGLHMILSKGNRFTASSVGLKLDLEGHFEALVNPWVNSKYKVQRDRCHSKKSRLDICKQEEIYPETPILKTSHPYNTILLSFCKMYVVRWTQRYKCDVIVFDRPKEILALIYCIEMFQGNLSGSQACERVKCIRKSALQCSVKSRITFCCHQR